MKSVILSLLGVSSGCINFSDQYENIRGSNVRGWASGNESSNENNKFVKDEQKTNARKKKREMIS
jgi:hypothetical protein